MLQNHLLVFTSFWARWNAEIVITFQAAAPDRAFPHRQDQRTWRGGSTLLEHPNSSRGFYFRCRYAMVNTRFLTNAVSFHPMRVKLRVLRISDTTGSIWPWGSWSRLAPGTSLPSTRWNVMKLATPRTQTPELGIDFPAEHRCVAAQPTHPACPHASHQQSDANNAFYDSVMLYNCICNVYCVMTAVVKCLPDDWNDVGRGGDIH